MKTFKELLAWTEAGYGNKEAIVDIDRNLRWTYTGLNAAARSFCAAYAAAGVEQGDRIGWLAMAPSADIVALSFGARKMGAIPVVMNVRASVERIAWMINNTGVKALSYTSDTAELLVRVTAQGVPSVRQFIALDEPISPDHLTVEAIYRDYADAEEPSALISPDDIAILVHTSGSTGRPKPVMHTEERWMATMRNGSYASALFYDDRVPMFLAPNFVGWAHATGGALSAAACQVCTRFDPTQLPKIIVREACTHLALTPSMVRMLYAEFERNPSEFAGNQVRAGMLGGERITPEVLEILGAMFPKLQRYGSLGATESVVAHTGLGNPRLAKDDGRLVGKPLPGITIELRDTESGEVIEGPGSGELFVYGPTAVGIWGDLEATAQNFPNGWWRSGDIVARDEEGYLFIVGRADNVFKSGGIKVSCEDVEAVLKSHPQIVDVVVVPVADERFGFVGHAFVRHRGVLDGELLSEWWRGRDDADSYARPRRWTMMGEEPFPMVTAAKVDRRGLRDRAHAEHQEPRVASSS